MDQRSTPPRCRQGGCTSTPPAWADLDRHTTLLQLAQRLRADLQHAQHAPREHDRSCPMIKQVGDVGRLDAGIVPGADVAPIPGPRPARVELRILTVPDRRCGPAPSGSRGSEAKAADSRTLVQDSRSDRCGRVRTGAGGGGRAAG